jgi:hypothetical protein
VILPLTTKVMSLQEVSVFFNDITEEDGNLDCLPKNIVICIYHFGTKYIMWGIDNYER